MVRSRRWTPAALAGALLLAVLLLPASASAQPAPGDVAAARALQTRLQAQYDRMEQLTEQVNDSAEQAGRLAGAAARSREELEKVQGQLTAAQAVLDRRARDLYMNGPAAALAPLVDAQDLGDAFRRGDIARSVLRADANAVDEVAALRAKVQAATTAADRAAAAGRAHAAAVSAKRTELTRMTAGLEAELRAAGPAVLVALQAGETADENGRRAAFAAWSAGLGDSGLRPGGAAVTAVRWALAQRGVPYLWGGTGAGGFDCSGLVQAAYGVAGVDLPRTSRDQFGAGRRVPLAELVPGDLVFFASDPSDPATIHHVGMYLGGGLMVHAPHTGDVVRIASVWRSGFAGAVRLVGAGGRAKPRPVRPDPPVITVPTTTVPPATAPPPTTAAPAASTAPAGTVPPGTVPPGAATTTTGPEPTPVPTP
jgi:cell wall-associated NlpC family hydrolase